MKYIVVLLLGVVAFALARPNEDKYTVKYDGINIDEVLKSDRLSENYYNCLIDFKPCAADGAELKSIIPDALKTSCAKCNEKQKAAARKVIQHLYKNKMQWWNTLEKKYDPEGTYVKTHAEELKKL